MFRDKVDMRSQPIAGAFDLDEHSVLQQSAQQRGCDDRLTEERPILQNRGWTSGSWRLFS